MPNLEQLGLIKEGWDKRSCYKFIGGEDYALKRMNEYILESKSVGNYQQTRNNLIGS